MQNVKPSLRAPGPAPARSQTNAAKAVAKSPGPLCMPGFFMALPPAGIDRRGRQLASSLAGVCGKKRHFLPDFNALSWEYMDVRERGPPSQPWQTFFQTPYTSSPMTRAPHSATEALLRDLLSQRILMLDGAMGTMIQQYKLAEEDYRGGPRPLHRLRRA